MTLRLAFVLARQPYLKTVGPLIDAALDRGMKVLLFTLPSGGVKASQAGSQKNLEMLRRQRLNKAWTSSFLRRAITRWSGRGPGFSLCEIPASS